MAINKVVNIEVNGDEAIKELEDLNKRIEALEGSVEDLNDELEKTGDVAKKDLDEVKKGADAGEKSVKKLGVTFKRLGTVIKAAGIGALLAVFAAFSKIAGESQDAIDGMATSMNFLQLIFTDMMNGFERFQAADSMGDYFKELGESAKLLTDLANLAAVSQAELGEIVAKSELDAEKLRRTRDDETKSYEERIKASEDLKKVIDDQLEASGELAQTEVDSAQARYDSNQSMANLILLIEARTKVLDEENRVATANSEWQMSHNSLVKDEIDLQRELKDSMIGVSVVKAAVYGDEALENELAHINRRKEAVVEAIEEISNAEGVGFAERKRMTAAYYDELLQLQKDGVNVEGEINQQRVAMGFETAALLVASAQNLAEEGTKAHKALGIAGVLIDTAAGIQKIWATNSNTPWGIAFAVAQTAFVATSGFQAIKKIMAVTPDGNSGSSGISAGATPAPSYNIVGATQSSTLEQQLLSEGITVNQDTPIKSYVVASDVTTQAALDRQIEANAGF